MIYRLRTLFAALGAGVKHIITRQREGWVNLRP